MVKGLDVFRLYQVIDPDAEITMPESVRADMIRFVALMDEDQSVDVRHLGLKGTTLKAVLSDLTRVYGLDR